MPLPDLNTLIYSSYLKINKKNESVLVLSAGIGGAGEKLVFSADTAIITQ